MKPDLINVWPNNCDYPLWRKMIRDNRSHFNKVITVFMETNNGYDYSHFVTEQLNGLSDCYYSPAIERGQDWRNVAVNYALEKVQNNWVFFTEQDFFPKPLFWAETLVGVANGADILAVYQGERMHPCGILAKIDVVNQTQKNFGIIPGVSDHFFLFQKETRDKKIFTYSPEGYEHLNGLSHNFSLITRSEMPVYEPQRFERYIRESVNCGERLCTPFLEVCNTYLSKFEST